MKNGNGIEASGRTGKVYVEKMGSGNYAALFFDAEKWPSAGGAYMFTDCTSARDSAGHWNDYTTGAAMVS